MKPTRCEEDFLGQVQIPSDRYYGIQTERAIENFPISNVSLKDFPVFIKSLAQVKHAAAAANAAAGLLDKKRAEAIISACEEVERGLFHDQFIIDMIQGGAGTSTNMNTNEVLANRALELMGKKKGEYEHCHPNNHVNRSQSTNDVYPTAVKLALIKYTGELVASVEKLAASFQRKAEEFREVIKIGRTQLQDAVPITLGQTFTAYAATLREEVERIQNLADLFKEINLGGTAVGTGINAPKEYRARVVPLLAEISGEEFVSAADLIEATQDTGAFVIYSSGVKRLAVKLSKICNDLRLLSSGPKAGLNEINLPPVQAGSSIMPGKVNPVIPEVVNQIAFKVIGHDLTVSMASEAGQLELNAFEPIIAYSLFSSIDMLCRGMNVLGERCVDGITANIDYCRRQVEESPGLITILTPELGYETCSKIAKESYATGRSVYHLIIEKKLMSEEELNEALKPAKMTFLD